MKVEEITVEGEAGSDFLEISLRIDRGKIIVTQTIEKLFSTYDEVLPLSHGITVTRTSVVNSSIPIKAIEDIIKNANKPSEVADGLYGILTGAVEGLPKLHLYTITIKATDGGITFVFEESPFERDSRIGIKVQIDTPKGKLEYSYIFEHVSVEDFHGFMRRHFSLDKDITEFARELVTFVIEEKNNDSFTIEDLIAGGIPPEEIIEAFMLYYNDKDSLTAIKANIAEHLLKKGYPVVFEDDTIKIEDTRQAH